VSRHDQDEFSYISPESAARIEKHFQKVFCHHVRRGELDGKEKDSSELCSGTDEGPRADDVHGSVGEY
jgi:hypothetical protein